MEAYNANAEIIPFGFDNAGATCYFNAMLQSMLSCTSFTNLLLRNKDNPKYLANPVVNKIIELLKLVNNERDKGVAANYRGISNYSILIWKEMVKFIREKNNINSHNFMLGQQCAGEGYGYLMECMEDIQSIQNLFLHRYKNLIYCDKCDNWVSSVESMYNMFMVQCDLKVEQIDKFKEYDTDTKPNQDAVQKIDPKISPKTSSDSTPEKDLSANTQDMNKFLAKQTGYIDKDFKCPNCKAAGEKYNMNCLVMVPEVLVVLSKKYENGRKLDKYTNFPKKLIFNGKDGKPLIYEAVSQIEHSGNLNSGHYWTISRRRHGWHILNDNSFSEAEFMPTNNTYIVFYHLF